MVELSRLVDAVIWKESDGKVDAVSPKGASGLMQLMPDTAREVAGKLGVPFDEKRLTTDAEYNKTLGTAYLQQMLDRYGGNHTLALAAYNAGPGNVDKWLTRYGDPRDGRITDDAWAASLPFKETRDYVTKIKGRLGETPASPTPPQDVAPADPYRSPIQNADLYTPLPATRDGQEILAAEMKANAPGFFEGAGLAAKQEWGFTWGLTHQSFEPDPAWKPDETYIKSNLADVPKEYWDFVAKESVSEADFTYRKNILQQDLEMQRKLSSMGWEGTALRLGAAVIDPVALGIGIASDGIASPFVAGLKASRVGRILATAGTAALGSTAAELIQYNYKPTSTALDLLYAAAGGAALGGVVGSLARNPHTAKEAAALTKAGVNLADAVEKHAANTHLHHAGAAEASWTEPIRSDALDFVRYLDDEVAPRTYTPLGQDWTRIDSVGQLKTSENPLSRAMGGSMAEDGVGNADKAIATVYSASEWGERVRRSMEVEYAQALKSSFNEWANSQGLTGLARVRAVPEFEEQVTRFIRNTDPTVTFDPTVQKLGRKVSELQGRIVELANNPGVSEGRLMRPVQGFGDIVNDPHYVMRQFDYRAVQEAAEKFGDKNMVQFIKEAFLARVGMEVADKLATKYARGYWKTIRKLGWGMDAKVQNAFSGRDIDYLKELLTDAGGLSKEEIEDIAAILKPKKDGANARAKARMDIDENYTGAIWLKDGTRAEPFRFDQLLNNNISHLFQSYNRQLTGAAALARIQIRNPKAPEELLVNGVTSKADWEMIKNQVRAVAAEVNQSQVSLDRDLKNLDFLHDAIAGIPHKDAGTPAGTILRMLQKYNFVRVMNQVGFAQVAEIGNITGQLGLKAAFTNMPGLRALWRNAKTGQIPDDLSRELEGIWGIGADWLRGSAHQRWDDFGSGILLGENNTLTRIDNVLDRGVRLTNAISGMSTVNTFLHRWVMRGIAQKFSDMAVKPTSANLNRMRTLGLDDKMLDRVLKQVDTHFTREDGLWAKKVTRLNLDQWTDVEAREAFTNAVDRWAKRIIQENDPGSMHRWFSHPIGKILIQFRSFMMGAWTKQTLHNIHMADRESFAAFMGSMLWGGIAYIAQTNAQAVGRSDQQKWLQERLSVENIGKAAFTRAGASSIFPMLIDSGMRMAGQDPMFDFRTTGLPSASIISSPTVDLYDRGVSALGGLISSTKDGRPMSQQEWRNVNSVLPFMNFLPWQATFNHLISDNPEREPKK